VWEACVVNGYMKTVARELAKYGLYLVGVCEVRCGKGSSEQAEDYKVLLWKGNENL
jgi:hypothetical protein